MALLPLQTRVPRLLPHILRSWGQDDAVYSEHLSVVVGRAICGSQGLRIAPQALQPELLRAPCAWSWILTLPKSVPGASRFGSRPSDGLATIPANSGRRSPTMASAPDKGPYSGPGRTNVLHFFRYISTYTDSEDSTLLSALDVLHDFLHPSICSR